MENEMNEYCPMCGEEVLTRRYPLRTRGIKLYHCSQECREKGHLKNLTTI